MGINAERSETDTPVRLKELIASCEISQAELARYVSSVCGRKVSRVLVNRAVNWGYQPPTIRDSGRRWKKLLTRTRVCMCG